MRNIIQIVCSVAVSLLLAGCGARDSGCSAVRMDIFAEAGFLTNTVYARVVNGSDDMRRVTIRATDPDGNSSTIGPVSIAANDSFTQRLGPVLKSYGTTQAELERAGSKFEIKACE